MFEKHLDKDILILGFGSEGQSSLKMLRKEFPRKIIGIADKAEFSNLPTEVKEILKDDNLTKHHFGDAYLEALDKYDVIVKTPGIPPCSPEIRRAKELGKIITSQTKIFFENVEQNQIIGITGTKGKSTTTTLIYNMLKNADIDAILVGNIGVPPLEALGTVSAGNSSDEAISPETQTELPQPNGLAMTKSPFFVFEMSSYQLDELRFSPHISIFLNAYEDHLDYHGSFENYISAKKNIFLHQDSNDYLIINNLFTDILPERISSRVYTFSLNENLTNFGCFVKNNALIYKIGGEEEAITTTDHVALKGEFNLQNAMAAIIASKILGVNNETIAKSLEEFIALPHRIEGIGTYHGITFYDDSISTIPQATIAALQTLGENVETLIMGGHNRGIDFSILGPEFTKRNIKNLILFPDSGKNIWDTISRTNPSIKGFFVENMTDAIDIAFKNTDPGKFCLLSPASPSFGIFKNYQDRGNSFREEIEKYK